MGVINAVCLIVKCHLFSSGKTKKINAKISKQKLTQNIIHQIKSITEYLRIINKQIYSLNLLLKNLYYKIKCLKIDG